MSSGATLSFDGGTFSLNNASAANSTGRIRLTTGTVNQTGTLTDGGDLQITGGTWNAGGAVNTATLTQTGGTLTGSGTVTVSGAMTWSGGNETGTGQTIVQGNATITNQIGIDDGRVVELHGSNSTLAANASINLNPTNAGNAAAGVLSNVSGATLSLTVMVTVSSRRTFVPQTTAP